MRATDLPGGVVRRDDLGVSHAVDGSAAVASAQRSRSERALVQSAQRGDPGAVEELYRRHWRQAYRAAYLVTRDAHAAEDIAQEAFLQAIRVLDRFDRARPFAPWLHRIVTNRALDWARAHALRRPAEAAHEAVAPEARSDLSDDLAEAIGRLAPDARWIALPLAHWNEREYLIGRAGAQRCCGSTLRELRRASHTHGRDECVAGD